MHRFLLRRAHLFLSEVYFFLIIRRPPRSTLFPTRRSSDLDLARPDVGQARTPRERRRRGLRSEEHTSELQSLRHLVCRLLLEKKNGSTRREARPRPQAGSR